jgi:sugar phosphate isomerase/epimerase
MNRRNFLALSGTLGAASLLPLTSCNMKEKKTYRMGLQLFSIHNDMSMDALGTLKAVKAMGYEDLEIYGFDSDEVTYYGIKAAEFKDILGELELTATSGHYGFSEYLQASDSDLERFVDQCIKGALALNKRYITWPWLAPELRTIENFKLLSERLNIIGEQVNGAGLGFAYHNHGFEFEDHKGETGYEVILRETDPSLVKLQMDLYWVMHSSKLTPKEWIERQPGRYVMWHIKDMDKVTRDYTELGNGSIDYVEILPDPARSGLEFYYLEQGGNYAESPMKSAATSAEYFKANLQRFL